MITCNGRHPRKLPTYQSSHFTQIYVGSITECEPPSSMVLPTEAIFVISDNRLYQI